MYRALAISKQHAVYSESYCNERRVGRPRGHYSSGFGELSRYKRTVDRLTLLEIVDNRNKNPHPIPLLFDSFLCNYTFDSTSALVPLDYAFRVQKCHPLPTTPHSSGWLYSRCPLPFPKRVFPFVQYYSIFGAFKCQILGHDENSIQRRKLSQNLKCWNFFVISGFLRKQFCWKRTVGIVQTGTRG